ncbi:hypothetical protein D3C85_1259650 [compost metagenome]
MVFGTHLFDVAEYEILDDTADFLLVHHPDKRIHGKSHEAIGLQSLKRFNRHRT